MVHGGAMSGMCGTAQYHFFPNTNTFQVEGRVCAQLPAVGGAIAGYSWTAVGKGLLEILKIGGLVSSATCLSLSVASIATCGGLSVHSCQVIRVTPFFSF